jgi:hypothetical protein
MSGACCGPDYDALFNESTARRELAAYRRKGPQKPTRLLIEALLAQGVDGATLLDIGGGIGVIQHELLAAGASTSLDVDASHPYLAAARLEAERRGLAEREEHRYGDFVVLADEVGPAEIVTLDRVICCYGDMPAMVTRSTEKAQRFYGVIYPVDRWWWRAFATVMNLGLRLFRNTFRIHVYPTRAVDALVRSRGFAPVTRIRGLVWQVWLYRRVTGTPATG